MAHHCLRRREELPSLIQFQSNGLCNERGGCGEDNEPAVVFELEELGYRLIGKSKTDTYLGLESRAIEGTPLHQWMETWRCSNCGSRNSPPYLNKPHEHT